MGFELRFLARWWPHCQVASKAHHWAILGPVPAPGKGPAVWPSWWPHGALKIIRQLCVGFKNDSQKQVQGNNAKAPQQFGLYLCSALQEPQKHTQWDQGNMRPHTAWDVHNRGSKDFSSRNLSGTTSRLHLTGPPWACLPGTGCW